MEKQTLGIVEKALKERAPKHFPIIIIVLDNEGEKLRELSKKYTKSAQNPPKS